MNRPPPPLLLRGHGPAAAAGPAALAGFVVATGWAHEPAYLRGVTERTLAGLARTPAVDAGFDVGPLLSVFWVQGSASMARTGLRDVLRRVAEPGTALRLGGTDPLVAPDDALLRARWGLRGFGVHGARRIGLVASRPADVAAVLGRIGLDTVGLFGVDVEVDNEWLPQRVVGGLRDPWTEPRVARPSLLPADQVALGWRWQQDDPTAAQLVAAVALESMPDAPPPLLIRRWLGARGVHRAVVLRAMPSDEQLTRMTRGWLQLAMDGPAPAALAEAHESASQVPTHPLEMVMLATERRLDAERPPAADQSRSAARVRESVRRMLAELVALGPPRSPLTQLADVVAEPDPDGSDQRLPGRTFRLTPLADRGANRGTSVVVGAAGVDFRGKQRRETFPAADIVSVETWDTGQARVTRVDGASRQLEPAAMRRPRTFVEALRQVAPDRTAHYPHALGPDPGLCAAYYQAGVGWLLSAVLLLAPALVVSLLFLGAALGGVRPTDERLAFAAIGAGFAVLAALATLRVVRRWRVARVVGARW